MSIRVCVESSIRTINLTPTPTPNFLPTPMHSYLSGVREREKEKHKESSGDGWRLGGDGFNPQ